MPPKTLKSPTPTTDTLGCPPASSVASTARIDQQSFQKPLLDALRKAGVPQGTIDQATQQQPDVWKITGYVTSIVTLDSKTEAHVYGDNTGLPMNGLALWALDFPPNDTKYLSELVRAMNYPHMRVTVWGTKPLNMPLQITELLIQWDYGMQPVGGQYLPPFDVREIESAPSNATN